MTYIGKTGRELAAKGRRTPMDRLTTDHNPDGEVTILRWTEGSLDTQTCTAGVTIQASEIAQVMSALTRSLDTWVKPTDDNYPWES